jgi:hypothetical protein
MSVQTARQIIEAYIERLQSELTFLGTAESGDLVAEIRSLLVDASGDDPVRAAAEITKIGDPAALAASILTEKGLSPAQGMSTAEWWRMGVAVPLDIVVGLAVPAYVAVAAYIFAEFARQSPWALLFGASTFAASLLWSWYVWRPWRTGGARRTAGMVVTGLAVVRAPGFRRVVRSRDLAALGMRSPALGAVFGIASLGVAALMLVWIVFGVYQFVNNPFPMTELANDAAFFEKAADRSGDQRQQARQVLEIMYDSLIQFGENYMGDRAVAGQTLDAYEAVVLRAQKEKISAYKIGELTKVFVGVWKTTVVETTSKGTHTVEYTLAMSLDFRPDLNGQPFDYTTSWTIEDISGEGLVPAP